MQLDEFIGEIERAIREFKADAEKNNQTKMDPSDWWDNFALFCFLSSAGGDGANGGDNDGNGGGSGSPGDTDAG